MSDITIPVPYNAGSVGTSVYQSHCCYLGNGKFLNVAAQTTPNYVFAWIANDANITTGSFTSSNSPMRVVMSSAQAPGSVYHVRVFKLNATTAALVLNSVVYVLKVDGSDNVTLTNATLNPGLALYPVGNSNVSMYTTSSNNVTALGSAWQFFTARDNVLYVFIGSNYYNNSGPMAYFASFKKIVYDPSADTLTISSLGSYTAPANASYWIARAELLDVPGSTTKLLTLRVQGGGANSLSLAYAPVTYAALIDASDTVTPISGLSAVGAQALCPLSTTTILGFTTSRTYLTYDGTAWNTSPAYIAAGGTSTPGSYVFAAYALDSNYFMLLSVTAVTGPGSNTPIDISTANFNSWGLRVGRFVDSTFGQSSPAGSAGIAGYWTASAPTYIYFDQQFVFRDGSSTFYMLGHNGTTPQLRTIYTPGG